jgi:hypothetical protein
MLTRTKSQDDDDKQTQGAVSPDSNEAHVGKPWTGKSERGAMLACLQEIILDGLRHGFFDCVVTCEMVNGRKRRVLIKAGKSHQFTIREEDLQN